MKTCHCLFWIALGWAIIAWPVESTIAADTPTMKADSKRSVLLEAEAMQQPGGWVVDQQFMDQMGSPFMLAHGLGVPVRDATTTVLFPEAGCYQVWVRTRDWVAPWKAPGAPGKFQVLVNGKPLPTIFGTKNKAWSWQYGGTIEITNTKVNVALHDLTGFEGRCDAILFSLEKSVPPNNEPELTVFRRELLGLPSVAEDGGKFDVVVTGGGIAGTCAAMSAARLGLHTALIQDRPVLGGNNSPEVGVRLGGKTNCEPYPHLGDLVNELGDAVIHADKCPDRTALVKKEKNLVLFPEFHVNEVEVADAKIGAVVAQNVRSGKRIRIVGRWFVDSTGDGTIGALAGADFDMVMTGHLGSTNLWSVVDTHSPSPFPRCPWALDLSKRPFPGRDERRVGQFSPGPGVKSINNRWYWECGHFRDPIRDAEWMRDYNFRAMYGAWDALKNVDKKYPNHIIAKASYVLGKRESRRLLGDVVLTSQDVRSGKKYKDGCYPCTHPMDLHLPNPDYAAGLGREAFIAYSYNEKYKTPYWGPYRTLYSRNIQNLFMAGRDVSATHEAFTATRVMKTGGIMGEIVGMAAAICKKHDAMPRDVYEKYLNELKTLMSQGVGKNRKK